MRIIYRKETGVSLIFASYEIKLALQILKAMNKLSPADFLKDAIKDIELDMKPKPPPVINHFHLCELCFMEIDDRLQNCLHLVRGEKSMWRHYTCPTLKEESKRER